jgi:hypothetical protein
VTHTIRLRDPWDATHQADGMVRFSRHFNRPTGLDGGDRVWLVIEGAAPPLAVSLNGHHVGQASRLPAHIAATSGRESHYEITPLLQPRNKLEIDLPASPSDAPSALGLVRLEIESP